MRPRSLLSRDLLLGSVRYLLQDASYKCNGSGTWIRLRWAELGIMSAAVATSSWAKVGIYVRFPLEMSSGISSPTVEVCTRIRVEVCINQWEFPKVFSEFSYHLVVHHVHISPHWANDASWSSASTELISLPMDDHRYVMIRHEPSRKNVHKWGKNVYNEAIARPLTSAFTQSLEWIDVTNFYNYQLMQMHSYCTKAYPWRLHKSHHLSWKTHIVSM